jgi:two-component system cell cycle response regulator
MTIARTRAVPDVPKLLGPTECLVELNGSRVGRIVRLEAPGLSVGRGMECDLVLDEDSVSRLHCRLTHTANGWAVLDEGSTNGTYLNERRLSATVHLVQGELLRVGGVVFKFLDDSEAAAAESHCHEAVYRLAVTDGLTGLFNKRHLIESLARELARTQRVRTPISVVLLDIDRFKNINDSFGHLAGDYALKALAHLLQTQLRRDEYLARYGGEEFAAVFVGAACDQAAERADALRRSCESHAFEFEGRRLSITFNAGVAQAEPAQTADEILGVADRRLYLAKQRGRNRVVAGGES